MEILKMSKPFRPTPSLKFRIAESLDSRQVSHPNTLL